MHNSILTQHLKLEGNLENPSTYETIRMHNKELFQKNPICFPQEFLLHKSSDTVPNPAAAKDIGLLLVAGLSCSSSLMAAVPWAEQSSCSPVQLLTRAGAADTHIQALLWFCLQGSLALIMTHKPERSRANWIHRAPKAAHSASVQVQATSAWTRALPNTKASQGARVLTALSSLKPFSYSRFMPGLAQYLPHPTASPVAFCSWSYLLASWTFTFSPEEVGNQLLTNPSC